MEMEWFRYILTKFLVQVSFTITCGDKIIMALNFLLYRTKF